MVDRIKFFIAAVFLGYLLYSSSSNPFVFIPPYIDMPALLEMSCCAAVSAVICYTVAAYWGATSACNQGEDVGLNTPASIVSRVFKAFILAWVAYISCAFLALAFHYVIGFSKGVAFAYVIVVVAGLVAFELRSSRNRLAGKKEGRRS